jgi:Ser/Thr protein kinase RdoA (MazF antagonist)
MDPAISKRYSDDIVHETMSRFGIQPGRIELLDGFESFIYSFSRDDGEYILRIGHSLRRTQELIQAEVDWINYLVAGGASVAEAIFSKNKRLVEPIDDHQGGFFLATAFVKAPGRHPTSAMWNKRLFETWGRLLGRIHALSKHYEPAQENCIREEWDSPGNMLVDAWLPPSEIVILRKFHALMRYLHTLPKDGDSYGLIHQDAHAGNLFVDENYKITLFDFDDCVYSWFVYDIAMVLFYGLIGHEEDPAHIETFCRHFLCGYSKENSLDPKWLAEIPQFLKLREIDLYAQILFSFGGLKNIDDPWCQNYMKSRKQKIERGAPYIAFNWASLSPYLTAV